MTLGKWKKHINSQNSHGCEFLHNTANRAQLDEPGSNNDNRNPGMGKNYEHVWEVHNLENTENHGVQFSDNCDRNFQNKHVSDNYEKNMQRDCYNLNHNGNVRDIKNVGHF